MNRFIGSTLAGALVLALGLGTMGCQEGATNTGSKEEGIKKAKEAGARMGEMQKQQIKAKMGATPPPAGGADEDKERAKEDKKEDKGKDKNKGGDKE